MTQSLWRPLPTQIHEPDRGGPCVHLLGEMPRVIAVDRESVGRLNFQPRFTRPPQPVIAARRGDTLILSVDMLGPLATRHPNRGMKDADRRVTHHWYFDLVECADDPNILTGVQRIEAARAHANCRKVTP